MAKAKGKKRKINLTRKKETATTSTSDNSSLESDNSEMQNAYAEKHMEQQSKPNDNKVVAGNKTVQTELFNNLQENEGQIDVSNHDVPVVQNNSFQRVLKIFSSDENKEVLQHDSEEETSASLTSSSDSDSYEEEYLKSIVVKNKPEPQIKHTQIDGPSMDGKTKRGEKFKYSNVAQNFPLSLCIVFLVALIAVSFVSNGNNDPPEHDLPSKEIDENMSQYQRKIKVVQQLFPNQHKRLWATIRVAIEQHYQTVDNAQPAVLMFASSDRGTHTAECLAKEIAELYSFGYKKPLRVRGIDLKALNSNAAKRKLDEDITQNFQSGSKSVVVSRFEEIPASATTTFYQFCENDYAPFKDVAVILTVQVIEGPWSISLDLDNVPIRQWDRVVSEFIEHSLNSRDPNIMTNDMIGGLLSRITPSVSWVRPEEISC